MKFDFIPGESPSYFESLRHDAIISELPVAGTTVRQAQIDYLEAAEHEFSKDDAEILLEENFWYAPDDLEKFSRGEDLSDQSFALRFPWDLLKLNEILVKQIDTDFILAKVYDGAQNEGFLYAGEGTKILPGVFIEGSVIIGENCKIGPNCYIRGNTFIGDNCHIGQSVEIKNSLIMNNTNVGHLSYIGDSILGEKVNLGAGTVSSNLRHDGTNHRTEFHGNMIDTGRRKFGVVIGDGVHTGINTSFYPGRKLYPGVTTRPGDIVQKDLKV
ncbi:hypothetical protein PQO03_00190 [Lentisphaera profundi]|uniref:Mannose-1-phosphate guanyltransferase C-terminal domain-containing protein n=1 Tax=Lentisphaera profundi TaxID=1658616 RepID=A0ABY7VU83_9BACT|nr:hypothetical protein [Lentisphaera profundi]WDE96386.1 hypothetical protein PQO03_00190 [Lentisphaera profundi]